MNNSHAILALKKLTGVQDLSTLDVAAITKLANAFQNKVIAAGQLNAFQAINPTIFLNVFKALADTLRDFIKLNETAVKGENEAFIATAKVIHAAMEKADTREERAALINQLAELNGQRSKAVDKKVSIAHTVLGTCLNLAVFMASGFFAYKAMSSTRNDGETQ